MKVYWILNPLGANISEDQKQTKSHTGGFVAKSDYDYVIGKEKQLEENSSSESSQEIQNVSLSALTILHYRSTLT